ncbi:hypothetical protein EUX98_g131 [Antrodiella citrinella]|uniref:Uncharacterized protein n=1 Tax=Antrodiella citrinella TaxID=2447956 RepID=A0A4S4N7R1_9APHY|nr:hypothetical protein EUX98_g131 [Antrodiella citrinella]
MPSSGVDRAAPPSATPSAAPSDQKSADVSSVTGSGSNTDIPPHVFRGALDTFSEVSIGRGLTDTTTFETGRTSISPNFQSFSVPVEGNTSRIHPSSSQLTGPSDAAAAAPNRCSTDGACVVSSNVVKPVQTPPAASGPPRAPEITESAATPLTSAQVPEGTKSATVPLTSQAPEAAEGVAVESTNHGAVPTPPFSPSSLAFPAAVPGVSPVDHLQANGQSSASISTITDRPETTLSSPVFVSTTDSAGHVSLSVPPVFTSLGVSTEPNGQLVSVTHVIANPTGIWGVGDNTVETKEGFFGNTGAVAGVFLVVGILVAAIASTIAWILCRKRRRRVLRNSISRPLPYPENPFEDPRETPSPTQMRYVGSDSSHRNLVGTVAAAPGRNLLDDEVDGNEDVPPAPLPPSLTYPTEVGQVYDRGRQPGSATNLRPMSQTMGLAGIGAGKRSFDRPSYNGPFSDYHGTRSVGHTKSYSTGGMPAFRGEPTRGPPASLNIRMQNLPPLSPPMEMPSVESSPSIYPSSLPPAPTPTQGADHGHDDDDDETDNEETIRIKPFIPPVPPVPPLPVQQPAPVTAAAARPRTNPPVIPPRSPLRHSGGYGTPATETKQALIIQTQMSAPQLKTAYQGYEPLTPPASLSSEGSPGSPREKTKNPFVEYQDEVLKAPALVSFPSSSTTLTQTSSAPSTSGSGSTEESVQNGNLRSQNNFYTRRTLIELRPATTEWKN